MNRAATEQRDSQLDRNTRRHPKNPRTGEIIWHGEQLVTQHCANCYLLQKEYGRVLFERDLAQRNLRLANYRLGDELQKKRNEENNGMGLTLFPSLVF